MQRLFSNFSGGWPGTGVLLLRLLAGAWLLDAAALGRPLLDIAHLISTILAALAGLLLIAGLFTPFAGIIGALLALWIAYSHPGTWWNSIGPVGLSLSLAILGPGAWSVDALLFGRKRIDLSEL